MQNLKFKQLLLISNSTKSANQFDFQSQLTIITADDNNYGKSTLAKLLLWSIGCDPAFDTNWKNLDCKTILRFSVGNQTYEAMRYKTIICLNDGKETKVYPKITGDYSKRIAEILSFHVLLPKRDVIALETPPPAYYFVPFYIDQKKSWSIAWDNFEGLHQYSSWKATIIKYHIGLLTKRYFELELEKYEKKSEQANVNTEIQRIDTTLEVVADFIPKNASTVNQDKLQRITKEIREDLKTLSEFQEKTFDELTKAEGDKAFLLHQKEISEKIIFELDKDYQYVVEHFAEGQIECPLCGTYHDNSIVNRASILTDKQQAENQFKEINIALGSCIKKLEKLKAQIEKTRNDIDIIQGKYIIEEEDAKVSLNDIIENVAGVAIRDNVTNLKSNKLESLEQLGKDIKSISDNQKDLLSNEEKDTILNAFTTTFASYIELLNAQDINTSVIRTPMDYAKIVKEGGAAEGTRGILAYYLTIFSLINNHGNEVIAPLIIDTPNQQEQSPDNYDKILGSITKRIPSTSQVILCALKNQKLENIKQGAKVINLDANKLLDSNKYEEISSEFEKYKLHELIDNDASSETPENEESNDAELL
jgi:hypothetical protein